MTHSHCIRVASGDSQRGPSSVSVCVCECVCECVCVCVCVRKRESESVSKLYVCMKSCGVKEKSSQLTLAQRSVLRLIKTCSHKIHAQAENPHIHTNTLSTRSHTHTHFK